MIYHYTKHQQWLVHDRLQCNVIRACRQLSMLSEPSSGAIPSSGRFCVKVERGTGWHSEYNYISLGYNPCTRNRTLCRKTFCVVLCCYFETLMADEERGWKGIVGARTGGLVEDSMNMLIVHLCSLKHDFGAFLDERRDSGRESPRARWANQS